MRLAACVEPQEVLRPAPISALCQPQADAEPKIHVEVDLSENVYTFDDKMWSTLKGKSKKVIEAGEEIRQQMALEFYVN